MTEFERVTNHLGHLRFGLLMRAHLLDSDDPLHEGDSLTAKCGIEVPHSHFVFYLDQEYSMGISPLNRFLFCTRCLMKSVGDRRYLYGLIPGQVALTGEEDRR